MGTGQSDTMCLGLMHYDINLEFMNENCKHVSKTFSLLTKQHQLVKKIPFKMLKCGGGGMARKAKPEKNDMGGDLGTGER